MYSNLTKLCVACTYECPESWKSEAKNDGLSIINTNNIASKFSRDDGFNCT